MVRACVSLLVGLSLVSGAALAAEPTAAAKTLLAPQERALRLLHTWVDAQNRADTPAYLALYDGKHFRGKKRTHHGVTQLDWKAWAADRTAMLKNHPTVVAERSTVETWLDPGTKLKRGVMRVRFLQRWKSARYADHGIKILDLVFDTRRDAWLIIHEDLLNSEPGFADPAPGAPRDVGKIASVDDAERALARLGLTAGDQSALDALPEAPQIRQLFASAILLGDLACDKITKESQCGEEVIEWSALDHKLAWPASCVRRRAAIWAVEHADERTLLRVSSKLAEVLAIGEPEREIPEALMRRIASASDALRMTFLRAIVKAHRALAEHSLAGLSQKSLAEAANDLGLDEAALALDEKVQRAAFVTAMLDEKLAASTRKALVQHATDVKGKDVEDALRKIADEADDCATAMAAALALEARGDRSRLPRHDKKASVAVLGRALCMLLHDTNQVRAETVWREFLPPKAAVTLSEDLVDEFAERDEDGNRIQPDMPDRTILRATSTLADLATEFGSTLASCSADACEAQTSDGTYTVRFSQGYVVAIHRHSEHYCPC